MAEARDLGAGPGRPRAKLADTPNIAPKRWTPTLPPRSTVCTGHQVSVGQGRTDYRSAWSEGNRSQVNVRYGGTGPQVTERQVLFYEETRQKLSYGNVENTALEIINILRRDTVY